MCKYKRRGSKITKYEQKYFMDDPRCQRNTFYSQRISESSYLRKETVDIHVLTTSRSDDRKIIQSIRITTISPSWISQPVQINICQSNTYRKDLSWLHFDNEPKVQERQQVKDQQSSIFFSIAYLTFPSSS